MLDITLEFGGKSWGDLLSTYDVQEEISLARLITTLSRKEIQRGKKLRAGISFQLVPLTQEQTGELYEALTDGETITVTYTNPHTDSDETAVFRLVSNLTSVFGMRSVDGNRYYKGGEITLRAVTAR